MKDIEELVNNTEKYKNALIQKRLDGHKNSVAYVTIEGKPRILKWFAPGLKQNMETEFSVLRKGSSKLKMPAVLEKDTDHSVLVLGYIMGKNLCDVINDSDVSFEQKQKMMTSLSAWFASFHEHFKSEDGFRIRGDASLRNFIYKDGVWGVDFEESRPGKPVEDIAGMCASILSTDPMFTDEKFQLCRIFIDSYRKLVTWPLDNISEAIAYGLLERIQWRPKDEEILRKNAKHIRKHGLSKTGHAL
jgi:tRNA A-37 threonylcarbamoyl transferase component Bud32